MLQKWVSWFTINVQQLSKKISNLFWLFFFNETYFYSAYIKFDILDLIGEKIYYDRKKKFILGKGEIYARLKQKQTRYRQKSTVI